MNSRTKKKIEYLKSQAATYIMMYEYDHDETFWKLAERCLIRAVEVREEYLNNMTIDLAMEFQDIVLPYQKTEIIKLEDDEDEEKAA